MTDLAAWPATLVTDLALGLDPLDDILLRHNVPQHRWDVLASHPAFIRAVATQAKEFGESGLTFRAKARAQAEDYLQQIDQIVVDATVDPKARIDAIKSVVKWAGLEPREEASQSSSPQVNIQINL
jgi:UDP-N-acetyl-D-mannosaminuronate dehydrogenase